jgi:hypothetical protein
MTSAHIDLGSEANSFRISGSGLLRSVQVMSSEKSIQFKKQSSSVAERMPCLSRQILKISEYDWK